MSLAEIKSAVCELSPKELAELAAFILKQDNAAWTQQIEKDAAGGKLDFLFDEAARERAAGQLRDWPEKGELTPSLPFSEDSGANRDAARCKCPAALRPRPPRSYPRAVAI